jgi:chromosome segregation ATPase
MQLVKIIECLIEKYEWIKYIAGLIEEASTSEGWIEKREIKLKDINNEKIDEIIKKHSKEIKIGKKLTKQEKKQVEKEIRKLKRLELDLLDEKDEIEESISNEKSKFKELKSKYKEIEKQFRKSLSFKNLSKINELTKQLNEIIAQIDEISKSISEKQNRINEIKLKIKEIRAKIKELKELLKQKEEIEIEVDIEKIKEEVVRYISDLIVGAKIEGNSYLIDTLDARRTEITDTIENIKIFIVETKKLKQELADEIENEIRKRSDNYESASMIEINALLLTTFSFLTNLCNERNN